MATGKRVRRGVTPTGKPYTAHHDPKGRTDIQMEIPRKDDHQHTAYKERSSSGKVTKGRIKAGITPGGRFYVASKDNKGTDINVEGKTVRQKKYRHEGTGGEARKVSYPKNSKGYPEILKYEPIKKGFKTPKRK